MVSLYLIENSATTTAATPLTARMFTVALNGVKVLNNYDLFVDAGAHVPVKKTFPVTVGSSGVQLDLTTQLRSAMLSAIEIIPVPVGPPPPPGLNTLNGLAANRPATCPAGVLTIYMATDTPDIWYCVRTAANPIGSVWIDARVVAQVAMVLQGAGSALSFSIVGGGTAQLGYLSASVTSPTVLTIGAWCSDVTPCNVRLGHTVYSVTSSTTVTLSGAGSGAVLIYFDPSGTLAVGYDPAVSVACSVGCVAVPGVTAFPDGAIPIYTSAAKFGVWDVAGHAGMDRRAFLSMERLIAGPGITLVDSGKETIISVDPALLAVPSGNRVVVK